MDGAIAFKLDGVAQAAQPDRLGHGTTVARIIRSTCSKAVITHAQVFDDRPVTTASCVGGALRWFAAMDRDDRMDLVCISLGINEDRQSLREAVEAAHSAGILIVASFPARGQACYPAAYQRVFAATGDARCINNRISRLGPRLFGTWGGVPDSGRQDVGGSSFGAARLAGHLAQVISKEGRSVGVNRLISQLERRASCFQSENRPHREW